MFKRARFLIFFSLPIIIIALFFYLAQPLLSQTEGIENIENDVLGLSISPATSDLQANPGDIIKGNVKIYNPTGQKVQVDISVEDFVPIGEEGFVQIIEPDLTRTTSLASWIKLEQDNFLVEPREQKIFNYSIEVPVDAEPGGKYSSIVANINNNSFGSITGPSLRQRIASLILLSVSGEVEENLVVKKFTGSEFQEYGPVNFQLYLENQGTVHLRPKGFVLITDWSNKKVAELSIPQTAVMPGARRNIEINWSEKNIIGKFTATVVGSYGKNNQPFTATRDFWVWPWKISLVILIVVIFLLIILIRGRKRIGAAFKILFKGEGSKNQIIEEKKAETAKEEKIGIATSEIEEKKPMDENNPQV